MKKEHFWQFGIPDESELEELNETIIEEVEKKIGIKFPIQYLELLKEKNGGLLYIPQVIPNFYGEDDNIQIDYLYGISSSDDEGVLLTNFYINEWNLPQNVVVLTGDAHWWLVFDYRNHNGNNPPISLIDLEYEMDTIIAADFESLLKRIEPLYEQNIFEANPIHQESYEKTYIEKVISMNEDVFTITDGFKYCLDKEKDFDWGMNQLKIIVKNPNYRVIFECLYYFYEALKKTNKAIDKEKFKEIYEEIIDYHNIYVSSPGLPRIGRRILKAIEK